MIGCIQAAAPYGPAVGTEHAKGSAALLAGVRGNLRHPVQAREYSDREPIVTSPSRGAPFEGGSDVATRSNPAGEGFAVPGPPPGSNARPYDGRANRDPGCARLAPDGTTRGVVDHRPGPGGLVVPGGRLHGHRGCPRLRVG